MRLDRWAGLFLAYSSLLTLGTPSEQRALVSVQLLALGLAAYAIVRSHGRSRWLRPGLVGLGALQALWAAAQLGGFDRLEVGERYHATGALGNPNWTGSFLAMTGALAPPLLMPLFLAGLFACGHRLGLLALLAAWSWRWRHRWRWLLPLGALAAGLALLFWTLDPDALGSPDSVRLRLAAWGYGLTLWLHNGVLVGIGPNGWATYVPSYQFALGQPGGLFLHAHNELLQVLVETGLIGATLAGAWAWSARGLLWTSWGPAGLALAVLSLGMFPLRVPVLGLAAALIIGQAQAEAAPEHV